MSRLKAAVVVTLLIVGGGTGALLGLNNFYEGKTLALIESRLTGSDWNFIDRLRVKAFETIQSLSHENRNEQLLIPLEKVPASATASSTEAWRSALRTAHDELFPIVEWLYKKLKVGSLLVLSPQGRVVVRAPEKKKFGESLRGLPVVAECLAGISRDGFYELEGEVKRIAAVPLLDARGKVSGCFMAADEFGLRDVTAFQKTTGLHAAIFLHNKALASTLEAKLLEPLASQLDSSNLIWFGESTMSEPWFVDFKNAGYTARSALLAGGTESMHVAVILALADLVAPIKGAQNTLLLVLAVLLVLGVLIELFLPQKAIDRDALRLRDAVKMLAGGQTSSLSVEGYSGIYRDLAATISELSSSGSRSFSSGFPGSVSGALGSHSDHSAARKPTGPGAAGTLDFESLLGEKGGFEPAPEPSLKPIRATSSIPPAPVPSPAEFFSSHPPPSDISGPRVDVPKDLMGIFSEPNETHELNLFTPTSQLKSGSGPEQITSSDYQPDATIVAPVPEELLRAAASSSPFMSSSDESSDQSHFKEVFEQFLNTKKQCLESTAGLTYERFLEKLKKNASDLKARYKCRSVRFQVYIKNGKAALKAIPVK